MKHKVLIVIYIISLLNILTSIATILTSDNKIEIFFSGLAGFISLIIIIGLWDRNEIARKVAIYYFGFQIFILLIGFIMSVLLIIQAEYIEGIVSLSISTTFTVALVFIIRGLNNPALLQEFNLTNSSSGTTNP